jgi:outer membrane protein assembly factor BamD (BamD/ComL family)
MPFTAPASDYQELNDRYFLDRSVDYAQQLLQNEEYLSVLYKSAVYQVKECQKGGFDAKALNSPFMSIAAEKFNYEDPALDSLSSSQRYLAWKNYEEKEFQRRLGIVSDVRSKLISEANSTQKQRMFRNDLEEALRYYSKKDWDMANLLFIRLLEDYHYNTIDDVFYYQIETNLQLNFKDSALNYIYQLLQNYPQSQYRPQAYLRASEILTSLSKGREQIRLYQAYAGENFPGDPIKMGGVYVRAAHAEMDLGHYVPAVDLLKRVDPKNSFYLSSRYLLADCYTALHNWDESITVLNEMVNVKQGDLPFLRWRMLTDEARIKLAYTHYENGDYKQAAELFNHVTANSPFYDRAMIGKAWINFQLDDYQATIKTTEEMLNFYPLSTEIYEANSLAGYCYEQMGDKNSSMACFHDVLEAGVGRSRLQNFLEERRRIMDALSELQPYEASVFASNNEQAYKEYRRARDLLEIGLKRIDLAQLLEVNSQMRALVAERVVLDSLLNVQFALMDKIDKSGNRNLMGEFVILEDRIYAMMEDLKIIGAEKVKDTPLYYQEAQIGFINTVADSLSAQIERETASLVATIKTTDQMRQSAIEQGQLQKAQNYGMELDNLNGSLEQSYLGHSDAEASHRPVLKTRVDRWSDFCFNRYAMGGLEFDQLEQKYNRLDSIDEYLSRLDDILANRHPKTEAGDQTAPQSP